MASKKVTINNATYTKLDTGVADALNVQNVSSLLVLVRFAVSAPALGDGGFRLDPGDILERGSITNDMFAIIEGDTVTADVEVGE